MLSVYLSALRLGPAELRAVCEGLMHPLNSLRREQAFLSLSPLPHSHSYPIDLSSSTPKYNASAIIYLAVFVVVVVVFLLNFGLITLFLRNSIISTSCC